MRRACTACGPSASPPGRSRASHALAMQGVTPCSTPTSRPSCKAYLGTRHAADRDRRLAGRQREVRARCSTLLDDIAALSDKITCRTPTATTRARRRSRSTAPATTSSLRFAGMPMGHEFTSLVLALLQVGGHPPKVDEDVIEQIRALDGEFNFETYFSLTCQNCPDVVQALNLMAVLNPRIQPRRHRRRAVPGRSRGAPGHGGADRLPERRSLRPGPHGRWKRSSPSSTPAPPRARPKKLTAKAPFDVLIVGGGPAGAAAAIYAARKGIRTGVAAERFGGQVLDTMAHRELHLGAGNRRPEARRRAGSSTCASTRSTS